MATTRPFTTNTKTTQALIVKTKLTQTMEQSPNAVISAAKQSIKRSPNIATKQSLPISTNEVKAHTDGSHKKTQELQDKPWRPRETGL